MNALSLQPGSNRKSAYNLRNPIAEGEERHTLVALGETSTEGDTGAVLV